MSGSGKSSLLRAGLLPSITRPGAVAGIDFWRRCLIRPSEAPDAIASLAAGLLRDGALPELTLEPVALAQLCRSSSDRALALVRQALTKAAAVAGSAHSQVRLVVAIDQMEELFTTEKEPASREVLVRLLTAFAGSGLVWVIATIRSDFFHRCSEIAGFSALKDGLGSYELLPPTGPEIAQIIREPARAAGLRYEETADRGRLDDVLQEAAAADPRSLPLLEFVLDALYGAGRDRRMLTFAAYRALGGLEGAIARRADEVVDSLPTDIQEALPAVLRALTTVRPGDEAVTARPAPLTEVASTPARLALVDALVGARRGIFEAVAADCFFDAARLCGGVGNAMQHRCGTHRQRENTLHDLSSLASNGRKLFGRIYSGDNSASSRSIIIDLKPVQVNSATHSHVRIGSEREYLHH